MISRSGISTTPKKPQHKIIIIVVKIYFSTLIHYDDKASKIDERKDTYHL